MWKHWNFIIHVIDFIAFILIAIPIISFHERINETVDDVERNMELEKNLTIVALILVSIGFCFKVYTHFF